MSMYDGSGPAHTLISAMRGGLYVDDAIIGPHCRHRTQNGAVEAAQNSDGGGQRSRPGN